MQLLEQLKILWNLRKDTVSYVIVFDTVSRNFLSVKPFKLSALDTHLSDGFTHSIKTYQAVSLITAFLLHLFPSNVE